MPDDESDRRPDGAVAVVRRAPFSDNPSVGPRGQRTQQRMVDAALRAFAEEGYHGCSVDRIARLANCSRVSFYQYFASKEDVFQHLAGQVARQVSASTEVLDELTGDLRGWTALRAWVARYAEIHARYEPVFHALESDEVLAVLARRTGEATFARFRARLATTTVPSRELDSVIGLLLECVNHTLDVGGILRFVGPGEYPPDRVEIAITDVLHRTLFGLQTDVNVHPADGQPPPPLRFGPEMLELLGRGSAADPDLSGIRALDALLTSGRDVFVERGYHNTRVEDLAAAAGISHGAFYRYFGNKDQLARTLIARAVQGVGTAVVDIPDVSLLEGAAGKAALRRWLSRYHDVHAGEAALLHVWVDAALQDPAIRAESAPILDRGRRLLSRYLQPRGFGDVDLDAVVMVALLGVFGARQRRPAEVDAGAYVIHRGLLGRGPWDWSTRDER